MAHVRAWLFRPPPEREAEFALAYGCDGLWAALFAKAPGFVATELLRPVEPGGWWLTLDRWDSEADYAAFQDRFGAEYDALDKELEGLSGEEKFVGAFS